MSVDEDDYNYSKFKELKTRNWPEGSLEKQLALRGAKNLVDAINKQIADNRELEELNRKLKEADGESNKNP